MRLRTIPSATMFRGMVWGSHQIGRISLVRGVGRLCMNRGRKGKGELVVL